MLGSFHLPPSTHADVQIFTNTEPLISATEVIVHKWVKPKGASMVYMAAISGGGGGGAGFTRASGNGGGGGGGACSGISTFICHANLLPDVLNVQAGCGGAGGVAGVSAAVTGTPSFVLTSKKPAIPNIILASGITSGPGAGAVGLVGSGGTGGAAPTIATIQPFHLLGIWTTTVGLIGVAGGTVGTAGASVTAWAGLTMSPGAGGGGVSTGTNPSGGAQTATAALDLGAAGFIPAGAGGVRAGGVNGGYIHGQQGFFMLEPFFATGGSGGAGQDAGVGGNGGKGGIGCGGGGGGAGTTGGSGGRGGDGLVVIMSW